VSGGLASTYWIEFGKLKEGFVDGELSCTWCLWKAESVPGAFWVLGLRVRARKEVLTWGRDSQLLVICLQGFAGSDANKLCQDLSSSLDINPGGLVAGCPSHLDIRPPPTLACPSVYKGLAEGFMIGSRAPGFSGKPQGDWTAWAMTLLHVSCLWVHTGCGDHRAAGSWVQFPYPPLATLTWVSHPILAWSPCVWEHEQSV
jgi:hypothetical protein